jgi:hypothetical protein
MEHTFYSGQLSKYKIQLQVINSARKNKTGKEKKEGHFSIHSNTESGERVFTGLKGWRPPHEYPGEGH